MKPQHRSSLRIRYPFSRRSFQVERDASAETGLVRIKGANGSGKTCALLDAAGQFGRSRLLPRSEYAGPRAFVGPNQPVFAGMPLGDVAQSLGQSLGVRHGRHLVATILEQMGFDDLLDRPEAQFYSLGENAAYYLSLSLALPYKVVCVDEVLAHVSTERRDLAAQIMTRKSTDRLVLVTGHVELPESLAFTHTWCCWPM